MNMCDCSEWTVRGCDDSALLRRERLTPLSAVETFVPGLVTYSLAQPAQPIQRELAIVFVDIADSTRMVVRQAPEVALAITQRVMRLVTEIALAHCGDVKDYEGDGALLYFGSIVHAAKAALALRAALGEDHQRGNLPVQARLSVHVGDVIIGEIGSPPRRSVAVIGPAVSLAARLLKHIPPGGVIAPQATIERLQRDAPEVAEQFQLLGPCVVLRGFEEECVTAYHIPPPGAPVPGSRSVNENSSHCHTPVSTP
ncbi:MAG: adenylate/guanylate cyclase domain-containing protein [candidate division KSB1 bacterium]|nr:adenylate/guanylate cyclase domain-containing protein [candidate division KSB1 bacterium]